MSTDPHASSVAGAPAAGAEPALWLKMTAAVGSLKLTLACLVLLLGAVTYVYDRGGEGHATLPLVLPLTLLSLNLFAAVVSNKTFRRQLPLLIFHLALIVIIVLVALGRMTYLRATAEVLTGGEFNGLDRIEAGPWHWGRKEAIRFENLGFQIEYKPGLQRDSTRNKLRWRDEAGIPHTEEIGDQEPLVIHGYRFYVSPNKGFAGLFRWEPTDGGAQLGSVIFPSYPLNKDDQSTQWRLGEMSILAKLIIPGVLIDPQKPGWFRQPGEHQVTLDFSWRVATLRPGEAVQLPAGRLVYLGLTTWMGYNVFYDWTMPWLLAACALAVLALGWHFVRKFAAKPWQAG